MATVLVVDDDEDIREFFGFVFGKAGHRSVEVGDVDSAVAALAAERFDLIVVDLQLPGGRARAGRGGLAVVDAARASSSPIPVLLVSGSEPPLEVAVQEGVRFLPKGVNGAALLRAASELLR